MSKQFDSFVVAVLDLKKETHLTQAWREKTPAERNAIRELYLSRIPNAVSASNAGTFIQSEAPRL